jgi:hypothetical protein
VLGKGKEEWKRGEDSHVTSWGQPPHVPGMLTQCHDVRISPSKTVKGKINRFDN